MTHLEGFGAFVDVGCGVVSLIGIENCSVSRISHPARRFTVGQEICIPCSQGATPTRDGSFSPTRSFWAPGWRTPPGFPPA
ncbi:MAG: hypothetical protein ACLR1T_04200 [Evtepia gabavorous]